MLGPQLPKVEQMLRDAHDDLLRRSPGSPPATWKKIWSTNPLERLQQGSQTPHRRRRGLPHLPALLRLASAVLVEAHDEWQVTAERRYLSGHSMAQVTEKKTDNHREVPSSN
jgi:transposase-like protein